VFSIHKNQHTDTVGQEHAVGPAVIVNRMEAAYTHTVSKEKEGDNQRVKKTNQRGSDGQGCV
jgi:hypothetical protein